MSKQSVQFERNKPRINNKTGYRGVSRHGIGYRAVIRFNGLQNYLGRFKTAKEASLVYELYRKELLKRSKEKEGSAQSTDSVQ